ncbi:MATE family efflux transporter [Zongyangia hominis]|uniref:Multidrug export protein MepA n=1 Tax=Zongyangia hominis TaxID=2763677 RepID=A0A926EBN9_9FIRM|nr:MATE family efflux transporter [Zongyangia hominis]MBC8569404.1 MATE family efflux transporter [Zongyangia hominis]
MENKNLSVEENPLATQSIGKLLTKFAIPSIISFLVSSLYNIVDQIFIGQGVGMLGNAATNVAFPLSTICSALALLLGVGCASNFNLSQGAGNRNRAAYIAGNGIISMAISGVTLSLIVLVFLKPLMLAFGSTEDVLSYALTYTGITAFGLPLVIFSTGCSQLIRSDGSPTYSMICVTSGAILNTILDPLFIFGFDMGIAGAAYATVLGQLLSAVLVLLYLPRFKTIRLTREHLRPRAMYIKSIVSLGAAACFNQLAMTVVQIALNNTLTHYGAMSIYGKEIPLACVGVISKVNIVYMGFAIGVAQGCQPIVGFNYGAKNYQRVKRTYLTGAVVITAISILAFLAFQIFPRQIVSIFGQGSDTYFRFAERYFRIYMLMTFVNGIQPLTSNFFTSIGKARRGILMSMTRQILFLLPLILLFPLFFGIDGVMYAGPIADAAAFLLAVIFIIREFHIMDRLSAPPASQEPASSET